MSGTVIIVLVVLLIVSLLLFALRGKGTLKSERLHAERMHDWEKDLSEPHEEELLRGVEAYRDAGHDLVLYHEGGKIDVFEPPMVVSLFALADAFRTQKDVRAILEGWAAREVPGKSMHLSMSWGEKVSGDAARFASLAHDLLSSARAEVSGLERSGMDEQRGVIDLGLRSGGGVQTVCIDLGRLAEDVQRRREQDDKTPHVELVRAALIAAMGRDSDGVLWVRPPTDAEREVARRAVEKSTVGTAAATG